MAAFIYENCDLSIPEFKEVFKRKARWANPSIQSCNEDYAAEIWLLYEYLRDVNKGHGTWLMDEKMLHFGQFIPHSAMKDIISDFAELNMEDQNKLAIVWILIMKTKYIEHRFYKRFIQDKRFRIMRRLLADKYINFTTIQYILDKLEIGKLQSIKSLKGMLNRDFLSQDDIDDILGDILGIIAL